MKRGSCSDNLHGESTARMTRARTAALCSAGGREPLKQSTRTAKQANTGKNSKMIVLDENASAIPRTATSNSQNSIVLKDVSNVALGNSNLNTCEGSFKKNCVNAGKHKPANRLRHTLAPCNAKNSQTTKSCKLGPCNTVANASVEGGTENVKNKKQQISHTASLQDRSPIKEHDDDVVSKKPKNICNMDDTLEKMGCCSKDLESMSDCRYIDIDSDLKNPQMCSTYAAEIYANLRVKELEQRITYDFMESIQTDITQSMRAILIDWLVEVAEEYKLVPDTLYLTVYLIDRYLSQNYIERQKLQLLGITCMLIASKYEEIVAPRVVEFCFITDNTYSGEDVRKMEKEVLNFLCFQLSMPTVKTFLRRFLCAAQASYKVPTLLLEFMANYLVELTLTDYAILKFLPSKIAASAVFLARWTLDQSGHPWNPTLQHFTCYNASDLKPTVHALQELQQDNKSSPLRAIREKYRQLKFESVANLPTQELLPTLFL